MTPITLRSGCGTLALLAMLFTAPASFAATPAVGDAYTYRLTNGFTREIAGQIRYEVTAASTAQGQVVTVTTDSPLIGPDRTEIHTTDGQWLRRPLDSHGINVEYEFSPALPSMSSGRAWSTRVNAKVPSENANVSLPSTMI